MGDRTINLRPKISFVVNLSYDEADSLLFVLHPEEYYLHV
jgi:hypothetical protein